MLGTRSAKRFPPLRDGQSWCGRNWEEHASGSRRKLKAAILNSSAEKARKVCCSGRMILEGYLLNLRVKVPPAQVPVWRRSHIRQLTGATLTAESPDVNVLKRGRETPDQPRRQAIRRAVARANGLIAEIPPSVELVAGYSECQAFPSPTRWPELVRKELGRARIRLPAEVEGGNSE